MNKESEQPWRAWDIKESEHVAPQVKTKNIPLIVGSICAIAYPICWAILWVSGATSNPQNSLLKLIIFLPAYPVKLLFSVLSVPEGMAGMGWALPAIIMIFVSALLTGFIIGYGITYAIIRLLNIDNNAPKEIEIMPDNEAKEK
jgi:hypothetical protein